METGFPDNIPEGFFVLFFMMENNRDLCYNAFVWNQIQGRKERKILQKIKLS